MTDLKWKITEDNRTTCGTAARQIIDRLFTGEFPQGAPVRESKLAKELNISRNVMREALNLIVGMGILEYVPYCGYRTKSFTMRDALEWYEIRESVEPIACRRLARQRPRKIIDRLEALLHRQRQAFADGNFLPAFQLDGDFHLELISSCGNRLFSGLADSGFIAIAFLFKNRMLAVQRDGHSIFSCMETASRSPVGDRNRHFSKPQEHAMKKFLVSVIWLATVALATAADVPRMLYCLQPQGARADFPAAVARTGRTHFIVDESFDGSDGQRWTRSEIAEMKKNGAVVLCYFSIGEAEKYRGYWRPEWERRQPPFLLTENPDWPGNYRVRYWDPVWRKILAAALNSILHAGFDGVYLDIVDGFEFFEAQSGLDSAVNPATGRTYRADMVALVRELADQARRYRPDFQIFIQNGEALLQDPALLKTIDGIAAEDVFCDGCRLQPRAEADYRMRLLQLAVKANKTVWLVEYPGNATLKAAVVGMARKNAIPLLTVDRLLRTFGETH